jgi:hypothetical protein
MLLTQCAGEVLRGQRVRVFRCSRFRLWGDGKLMWFRSICTAVLRLCGRLLLGSSVVRRGLLCLSGVSGRWFLPLWVLVLLVFFCLTRCVRRGLLLWFAGFFSFVPLSLLSLSVVCCVSFLLAGPLLPCGDCPGVCGVICVLAAFVFAVGRAVGLLVLLCYSPVSCARIVCPSLVLRPPVQLALCRICA